MKFLVVGASGFAGKYIFEYIKSLKYEVMGTQCNSRYQGLITFNILKQRIKDCLDADFFKGEGPIFGIICLAVRQIDRCLREKEISYKINVENTIRLINDMQSLNITPVFLSSDNIYDGSRGGYMETDRPAPINEYGRQKAEVERYFQNNVPEGIILRLSKIVSDNPEDNHFFSEWHRCIKEKRAIICIEGQVFSPTFVGDIAKAVVLACEKRLSGLYNVANTESFLRAELAGQFLSALKRSDVDIVCKPQEDFNFADPRPKKTDLNSTKFIKTTGMQFASIAEVLKAFIKNLQSIS